MRNICKSVLLIAVLVAALIPERLHAQASTEGKEFWVSSTIVCSPKDKGAIPYIAISAQEACTITIQGGEGANPINITQQVRAGSWNEFGNSGKTYNNTTPYYNDDPTQGPINVQMDASKWYPITQRDPSTVCNLAGATHMYGLHITATANISVYVIVRAEASMDASNILPVTALGSEYYLQDYTPEAHNSSSDWNNAGNMVTMTTILGTDDAATTVEITPNGNTYDGHQSGVTYPITLTKGQTYYLISQKEKQLSGTHILAKDGKKIAVFTGAPLTRLPNGVSARDALFEQPMPIEYWGTQFIVTRSLKKNGNLIGITATQRGTEIKIDGYAQAYINEGETYYIMLQASNDPNARDAGTSHVDKVITQDVVYIETSCPCAVYSYDTGNGYKGRNADEIDNSKGDPSSVWVAPLQQKIKKITFGTCYTDRTKDHFLNIVAETATCQTTKLTSIYGTREIDQTRLLVWEPVPGNTQYSYARAQIGDNTPDYSVFRLESDRGFIATIYGNGNDESYAYSAGSAAVEQGVSIDGEAFSNGYISSTKFCNGKELTFDANELGTDEIVRVDWDFGDGISEANGNPQTTHQYNVPGWYDVSASLYGHQVCTDEADQFLGSLTFSFRVVRPDTQYVYVHRCLDPIDTDAAGTTPGNTNNNSEAIPNDTIPQRGVADCSDRVDTIVIWGRSTVFNDEVRAKDSYYEPLNGITYPQNPDNEQEYDQTIELNLTELFGTKNADDCDTIIRRHIIITTCLDMNIPNDSAAQHICPGGSLDVPYTFKRGTIGDSYVMINGQRTVVDVANGIVTLPVEDLKPGLYKPVVYVQDPNCGQTLEFPLDLAVYYPSDIFKYKYNNVLAVYKNGYGGNTGYDFTGYQWYRNGQAIEGATESVYHDANPFTAGDEYYVVLTDKNGASLPSCPQTIENVPDFTPQENGAPEKVLINQRMYIILDNQMYDMFGQKVK